MRTLIAVALGCTIGAVGTLAIVHLGLRHGGLVVAAVAAAMLIIEFANAVRRSRR